MDLSICLVVWILNQRQNCHSKVKRQHVMNSALEPGLKRHRVGTQGSPIASWLNQPKTRGEQLSLLDNETPWVITVSDQQHRCAERRGRACDPVKAEDEYIKRWFRIDVRCMSRTWLGLRQRAGRHSCTEAGQGGGSCLAQQLGVEGKAKCPMSEVEGRWVTPRAVLDSDRAKPWKLPVPGWSGKSSQRAFQEQLDWGEKQVGEQIEGGSSRASCRSTLAGLQRNTCLSSFCCVFHPFVFP